jgi:ribosomal protein S8
VALAGREGSYSGCSLMVLALGLVKTFRVKIVVELNGRLNKCGVISPRYNVGVGELEAWTTRLLPSR